MNPFAQRLPQFIAFGVTAVFAILGMVFADQISRENYRPVALFFALAAGTIVFLAFGSRMWIFMLVLMPFTGRISVLPIPFNLSQLGIFAAFGMYLVMLIFKMQKVKMRWQLLDTLLFLNLIYLLTVFIRNPVGTRIFPGEMVGGRPYVEVIISLLGYMVLTHVICSARVALALPYISLGASLVTSGLSILTWFAPGLTPWVYPLYSGVSTSNYIAELEGRDAKTSIGENRISPFQSLGMVLARFCLARWNPTSLFNPLYPLRGAMFFFGCIGILLSGYRSSIAQVIGWFCVASFIKERSLGLGRNILLMGLALFILVSTHNAGFELPKSFQRALSWLPGEWDRPTAQGAQESTEWRIEMWKTALTSDRYIRNKLLGDGFGVSRANLAIIEAIRDGGGGFVGSNNQQEVFMILGTFHSGPVTTIRVVGVVGLIFYLCLRCYMAYFCFQLIRRTKGTPFEFAVMFASIPVIFEVFNFIFIFGDYGNSIPAVTLGVGMLKLLDASHARWKEEQDASNAPKALPAPAPVATT